MAHRFGVKRFFISYQLSVINISLISVNHDNQYNQRSIMFLDLKIHSVFKKSNLK